MQDGGTDAKSLGVVSPGRDAALDAKQKPVILMSVVERRCRPYVAFELSAWGRTHHFNPEDLPARRTTEWDLPRDQ
jgi:hypothetical protein